MTSADFRRTAAAATAAVAMLTMACRAPAPSPSTAEPAVVAERPSDPTPEPPPARSAVDAVRPVDPALARALGDTLRRVLRQALADSAFPGAVAVVGNSSGILAVHSVGATDWGTGNAVDPGTIWDLASLTKVLGMTTAIMQLVESGRVELDAPVQRYLPEWRGPNKDRVTVRHLLTHTSGLPSFRAYDRITTRADSIAALIVAEPLLWTPGDTMVYSDLGAFLAGRVVERVSGEPLDVYVVRHIFAPLGMTATRYNPPATWRTRIAPTEIDSLRGGKVHGAVHDERAYYLGGVSAHAGLFGSADDLARFARALLNGGTLDGVRLVQKSTLEQFTARQRGSRAIGWEKPTGMNSAGRRMSERAFGHTGFTGTSIWMDPERDVFVLLLSNRVNPTRNNPRIIRVRPVLTDALLAAMGAPLTFTASRP